MDEKVKIDFGNMMGVITVFVFAMLSCPAILNAIVSLTMEIQNYSITLADRYAIMFLCFLYKSLQSRCFYCLSTSSYFSNFSYTIQRDKQ